MNVLGNNDLQSLILKLLKSNYDFSYFCELFKENKFFEYYAKLPNKDKFNIVFFIKLIEKNGEHLIQCGDSEFYNEIKKWQGNLFDKLNEGKITPSELEFAIKLIADGIINNEKIDKNLIFKLSENYIMKSPLMIADELPILLIYNFYLINQFTNSKYNTSFITGAYSFAQTNYSEYPETIFINYGIYHQLLGLEHISKQDYLEMFCYQTFALLHEFKHLKQFEYMNSHDDEYAKTIGLDMSVVGYDYEFYQENHDMFFLEREANAFGYENLEKFCHNLLSQDYIQKFIELSKSSSNKLSKEEFKVKYDEICSKIVKLISEDDKKQSF